MRTDLENLIGAIVSDGWPTETTGTVDAPGGHVALIDLTMAGPDLVVKRDELDLSMTDAELYDLEGWHVVTTTDQGFIRDDRYGSEDDARDAFDKAEESYALWDDEGDDDDAPVDATHGPCSHPLCCGDDDA